MNSKITLTLFLCLFTSASYCASRDQFLPTSSNLPPTSKTEPTTNWSRFMSLGAGFVGGAMAAQGNHRLHYVGYGLATTGAVTGLLSVQDPILKRIPRNSPLQDIQNTQAYKTWHPKMIACLEVSTGFGAGFAIAKAFKFTRFLFSPTVSNK